MSRKLLIFALGFVLTAGLAAAGTQYFRIVRLSYVEGHVSFQHMGDVDWSAATVNLALQPGDRLYTGDDGRAEVEFDEGSILRLAEGTDVEFLTSGEDLIQVRILMGLATLTVRSHIAFEINTPAAAFNTNQPGVYRFDILEDGITDAIVRKGVLDAQNQNFSLRLDSGELVHVTPGDQGTHLVARYKQRDQWDEWNDRRNADLLAYESRQYLPDYVYAGASDLDRYGNWVVVDTYGPAWVPHHVGPDWSPYWVGRWYHRPSWGWTWCSYEPWGWLPYHYGRWHFSVNIGWCWLPGASFGFHFWSPGLVRFHHGHGRVGWYPLGPGDYYNVNHYHYNPTHNYYLKNIRMSQRRGPGDLANRGGRRAFRVVTEEQFANHSLGGRGEGLALGDRDSARLERNMITDRLSIRPTGRSASPLPDRAANGSSIGRDRAAVLRTEPSIAAEGSQYIRLRNTARTSGTTRSSRQTSRGDRSVQSPRSTGSARTRATAIPSAAAGGRTGAARKSSKVESTYAPRSKGRAYTIRSRPVNSTSLRSRTGRSDRKAVSSPSARSNLVASPRTSATKSSPSSVTGRSQRTQRTGRTNPSVISRGNVGQTPANSRKNSVGRTPSSQSGTRILRSPSQKTNGPVTTRPPVTPSRRSMSTGATRSGRQGSRIQSNPRTRTGSSRDPSSSRIYPSARPAQNSGNTRIRSSRPSQSPRVTRIAPSRNYSSSRSRTPAAVSSPRSFGRTSPSKARMGNFSSRQSITPSRSRAPSSRSSMRVNPSGGSRNNGRISTPSKRSPQTRRAPNRSRPRRP